MDSGEVFVYCIVLDLGECGDGGWTLVMKIDGKKPNFHFSSKPWSSKPEFNLAGGKTGFDTEQTKLPTYWNTPFSKICLGMKIGDKLNFILISKKASSLYSLIADGQYRPIELGRYMWKTLTGSQASLQLNCNKEGSTRRATAPIRATRIGILGNDNHDCKMVDSRIGFGTEGGYDDSNTCGNEAMWGDNGHKHIKAMGYIFVQ